MPELPEVETIKRGLEPLTAAKTIARARIERPELCIPRSSLLSGLADLEGRRISALKRRGKYLIFYLEARQTYTDAAPQRAESNSPAGRCAERLVLVMHLRMSGRCLFFPPEARSTPSAPHTHIILDLEDGGGRDAGQIRWQDPRRFGRWELFTQNDFSNWKKGPGALGPEPFDAACNAEMLRTFADHHAKLSLAALLLDQRCIAGLGNIYVQELLFKSGLHPLTPASALQERDWEKLLQHLKPLLAEAIERGGTSFRDYVGATGQAGAYAQKLAVYGRSGSACDRCGTVLQAVQCAGRRMVFCPNCQKRRRPGARKPGSRPRQTPRPKKNASARTRQQEQKGAGLV